MRRKFSVTSLALVTTTFAASIVAQDDAPSSSGFVVEEVIVTANKREERLQDVPMSVSAFGGDFFKDSGATDFTSLEQYTPSLKIQTGADSRSTSIRIRGIGSVGTNSGIDPSVGVFIDGVYQGRAGMSIGDMMDIERVEVLRGPQGTLYGKNTAAGAISIFSRKPTSEFESENELVYANNARGELRSMVNLPLGDSGHGVRLSAYGIKGDHIYENTYTGEGLNNANKFGVKSRFLFDFEDSELYVNLDYSGENTDCCALAVIDYNGFSQDVIKSPITNTPSRDLQQLLGNDANGNPIFQYIALEDSETHIGPPPKANPFSGEYWINEKLHNTVGVGGVSAEWNTDLDNGDGISFINAWRTYESDSSFDGDFTAYDAVAAGQTLETLDQYSTELRITSPGGDTVDYQGGLYGFYSDMETEGVLGMNYPLLRNSGLDDVLGNQTRNYDTNDYETTSFAAYGQLVWNVTDKFNATLGLRYTWEKKDRAGSQITDPATDLDIPPIAGPNVYFDQKRIDSDISPALNLRYYWSEELMTYASVSRGFKSGGFDQRRVPVTRDANGDVPINGGDDTAGEFSEEIATNYELGWKASYLDRRLTLNGTLYLVDYEDFQSQSFDGTSIKVTNAGSLQSYGSELEITLVPTAELILGTAIGFNKAEYKEFDNGQCTVDRAIYQQYVLGDTSPCVVDLAGKPLDNAPEWTFSSYLQYEASLGENFLWISRVEHNYIDSFFLDQDLDPKLYNDAVDLVNLRFTLTNQTRDWEISLWGRNLLGEEYYVMGIDLPTIGGYAGVPAPDLTYGTTLRYNF